MEFWFVVQTKIVTTHGIIQDGSFFMRPVHHAEEM
jgi:hypothetical protein